MHDLRSRRGYFTAELILVLSACLLFMPVGLSCIRQLISLLEFREEVQDEIALCQLRHIMIVSDGFEVYPDQIRFVYHEEENVLRSVNQHLIISPGTQIFLSDTDEVSFHIANDVIIVRYERNGRIMERAIVHV